MICKQIVHTGTLPIQIRDINGFTEESARALQNALKEAQKSGKRYASVKKALSDIL